MHQTQDDQSIAIASLNGITQRFTKVPRTYKLFKTTRTWLHSFYVSNLHVPFELGFAHCLIVMELFLKLGLAEVWVLQ